MKILVNNQNKAYLTSQGKVIKASQSSYLIVTSSAESLLTVNGTSYQLGIDETEHTFLIGAGVITVSASKSQMITRTNTITISTNGVYRLSIYPSAIPLEYQAVSYIQGTGTQFINTGVLNSWSSTCVYDIDFEITSFSVSTSEWHLIGAKGSSSISPSLFGGNTRSYLNRWCASGTAYTIGNVTYGKNLLHIVFDSSSVSQWIFNGVSGSGGSSYKSSSTTAKFCIMREGETYPAFGCAKVYKVKITLDDDIKFNGIPCYRISDNVAGMYDTISETFCPNAGTGTFIVGENI